LRTVSFDLKTLSAVTGKDPVRVAADVFDSWLISAAV
jgi:hypothetical protein